MSRSKEHGSCGQSKLMGGAGHTGRRGSCAWRTLVDVASTPAGGGVAPQLVTGAAPCSLVASVSASPAGPILDRGEDPAGLVWGLARHWAVVLDPGS